MRQLTKADIVSPFRLMNIRSGTELDIRMKMDFHSREARDEEVREEPAIHKGNAGLRTDHGRLHSIICVVQ